MRRFLVPALGLALLGDGCACGTLAVDDGGVSVDAGDSIDDAGGQGPDAGGGSDDAGVTDRDGGTDAGSEDAGVPGDGGDAGLVADAGDGTDAGSFADDSGVDAGAAVDDAGEPGPLAFKAVTFNTGTNENLDHDSDGDSYTQAMADLTNQYYGNGLSWLDAMDGVATFFASESPELVAFQEIFHPGECVDIPSAYYSGFVCDGWMPGDPTVAQTVLGAGYQVACNLGKPDKCLGVKKTFAAIRGCEADLCLDGLDGAVASGCGSGSRVGRAVLDLVGGGELTVVTVHGTSGVSDADIQCREDQIEQVFTDLDGEPGANGARNLILGDFNTDPGRAALVDNSADRWTDYVGPFKDFHFISDVGFGAEPTYDDHFNIDHVVSDVLVGSCYAPGVTAAHPPVLDTVYFDHTPIVCNVVEE